MARLPEFMKNMGTKQNSRLLINDIVRAVNETKQDIEEQSKYYNLQWKMNMLVTLKQEAIKLYKQAIEEANEVTAEYEQKIREIEATQYPGARVDRDDILSIDYELRTLRAELNMTDNKQAVIDKYLGSTMGAKAVLLMFEDPNIDLGFWTKEIYVQAFLKSKSQAELDFEKQKQNRINALKLEQAEQFNTGTLLAAQRILEGNPAKGMPTLENMFDEEIRQVQRMMDNEKEVMRNELRREIMKEGAENGTN